MSTAGEVAEYLRLSLKWRGLAGCAGDASVFVACFVAYLLLRHLA
jgi:hypothetical protein